MRAHQLTAAVLSALVLSACALADNHNQVEEARNQITRQVAESTADSIWILNSRQKSDGSTDDEILARISSRSEKITDTQTFISASNLPQGEKSQVTDYLSALKLAITSYRTYKNKMIEAAAAINRVEADLKTGVRLIGREGIGDHMIRTKQDERDMQESMKAVCSAYHEYRRTLSLLLANVQSTGLEGYLLADPKVIMDIIASYSEIDRLSCNPN